MQIIYAFVEVDLNFFVMTVYILYTFVFSVQVMYIAILLFNTET